MRAVASAVSDGDGLERGEAVERLEPLLATITATDAGRSLVSAAYPGQHMTVDAIREAAGNIVGAQRMDQAKTRYLMDVGTKRDTAGYSRKEIQFDQAADPRIWQYKEMADGPAKKAFAQDLMKQDPKFADRIKQLEAMGAM